MPTSTKLRWGILGAAKINERLLPAFAKADNAELRALASRSLERARATAEAAGIPVAHGSYEALLDDRDIDAVYIPLPNTLHAEWTRKAADRGKHVLCEKPLCISAADAQQVVDYCQAKKVKLMDGFMWPHHPRTARLKQYLQEGNIGAVRHVASAFTFLLQPLEPSNIRLQAEVGGGGLLDVGCYPVYGIRWAFGAEPVKAFATALYKHNVDVELTGTLWLSDGRTATFDCGFTLPYRAWMEITGTEGVVFVPDLWLPPRRATFEIHRDNTRDVEEVVVEGEDQIVHMIQNFSRTVLEERPVQPDPMEAVRTLRVLDALARSAKEGQVVMV
jgi:predicted dehydrogenase